MRTTLLGLMAACLLLVAASRVAAQVHAGDVVLTVAGGRVVVNGTDDIGMVVPNRVFADWFGKLGPSLPNRTPDPGFNSLPGQFPAGALVGVRMTRAARVWTPRPGGAGEGEFCTIPDERIEIRKSGFTITTPAADPVPDTAGPSIELGVSDPVDGLLHEHGVFWLTSPFDAGVYLLELRVWASGVADSDPVWIVLNQNRPQQEADDAVTWLLANVANQLGAGGSLCPSTPACPCDWNVSGGLSVQDIFDFLNGYFMGMGDFNGSGATTVQDVFAFLVCYFGGC